MLQFFRNFFKSRFGVAFTLVFLALIAFAFASSDVANTGMFGGVSGGDRVAVVGEQRIDSSELFNRARNELDRARAEDPTQTMESFLANNGLDGTLDALIARNALAEVAREGGFRAGQRLVDSELVKDPRLRGADGNFSADTFRQILRQQGLTEASYRDDIAVGLLAQQMLSPIQVVPQMPRSIATRYAQMALETRSGTIAALPASAFAPAGEPTAAQLNAYYAENTQRYIRPERRVIRYAVFGEEAFGNIAAPTEAQIAERYRRDAAQYAARDTRRFTQLIVTTRAAAQAIVDEVNAGTSLEESARAKGLSTTSVAMTTKEDLAEAVSPAVANVAFAAARGAVSAPAQGGIGWYIMRVDEVASQPGRTLAQARPEIVAALTTELRREALNEATARIDEEFSDGRSLSETAQELGLELVTTRPLTAAGRIYGTEDMAPAELAPVLATAFEMEESEPQLAETVAGERFVIFDVARVTPSAAAPLAEIRDQVIAAWRQSEGMKAAGAAATRILQRVNGGSSLADAVAAEDVALPPAEAVSLSREEINNSGNVTRPMALFFAMAKDTTKLIEVVEMAAWWVLQLDEVDAPAVPADSPLVNGTRQQLAGLLPDEYTAQFIAALRSQLEVEINQPAVDAVAAQLAGRNN